MNFAFVGWHWWDALVDPAILFVAGIAVVSALVLLLAALLSRK